MSLELELLLVKIGTWLVWPIFGILAGLLIGWVKQVDLKIYFQSTGIGYFFGLVIVALGYLGLGIWSAHNGAPYNAGLAFLNFAIQIAMFYSSCVLAAYWIRSIRNAQNR